MTARIRWSEYDAPDATIDPATPRKDTRQDYNLSTDIPLSRRMALVMAFNYTEVDSNLPNNTFDNVGGSVGAVLRF